MKLAGISLIGCLALTVSAWAQEDEGAEAEATAPALCADAGDEIDQLICENPVLNSDAQALNSVWSIWETGINKDRIDYIKQEQTDWFAARSECLAEADPAMCLQTRYEARVVMLTQPRIFQREVAIDGGNYKRYAAMTPLKYIGLDLGENIAGAPYTEGFVSEVQSRINAPADEECNMCTLDQETKIDQGFDGPSLLILNEEMVETIDDGDPVFNYQSLIIDKSTSQPINFLELFDPSTAPFAKNAIIEAIMAELNRLNLSVTGNENGETQYFWNETDANLQAQGEEEWSKMGLFPIVEGGVITGFRYEADSFEFAPYGSSQYFSDFTIATAPIVAFLKPQYRANFQ